jgi:hypothetical protein
MRAAGLLALSLAAAACGGGGGGSGSDDGAGGGGGGGAGAATTYLVAVDVRGVGATGIVLLNGGTDALTIAVDGRHTFSRALTAGQPYSISVQQQPAARVCAATNGTGVVNAASPPVVVVECLDRVVRIATGLWIVTRATTSGFEQNLYARSHTTDLYHFRIRPIDGGLDPAGPTWSPFPGHSAIVSFEFSLDGKSVYADDRLGNIRAATLRDTDGVLVPTWSGVLGQYVPAPPVLFGSSVLSVDGQTLYQNFNAIIGGIQYQHLWLGHLGVAGVSTVTGSPFPIGSDSTINLEPSGGFFASPSRTQSQIAVYRTSSSATQTPELVASYPFSLGANTFGLAGEEKPGRWLWEVNLVSVDGSASATPQAAAHRWRPDGSIESLGGPLTGVSVSGEIAATVCTNGETSTQRTSTIGLLPATAADYRYAIQRQDTRCRNPFAGPLVDTRMLALFFLRITNGQAQLVPLAVDTSDLGVFGAAHPTKPWLFIGSKFSQRVHAYSVDAATGSIQALAGSPFNAFSIPASNGPSHPTMIIEPAGRYLYLSRYPESSSPRAVHAFSIDQTTGALTAIATYTLP